MLNYLIRILSFQPCVTWPADRPLTRAILRGENAPQCIKLPYKKMQYPHVFHSLNQFVCLHSR